MNWHNKEEIPKLYKVSRPSLTDSDIAEVSNTLLYEVWSRGSRKKYDLGYVIKKKDGRIIWYLDHTNSTNLLRWVDIED